jgi:hypothetical protein
MSEWLSERMSERTNERRTSKYYTPRGSSVFTASTLDVNGQDSVPGRNCYFFFSHRVELGSPILWILVTSYPGVRWLGLRHFR